MQLMSEMCKTLVLSLLMTFVISVQKMRAVSVQGAKFIQICGLVLLFPLPGKTASHLATMKAKMMVTHSGSESAKQEAQ